MSNDNQPNNDLKPISPVTYARMAAYSAAMESVNKSIAEAHEKGVSPDTFIEMEKLFLEFMLASRAATEAVAREAGITGA
jgi:hypothetical protein